MEPNVLAWFVVTVGGVWFAVWLLWKMYEHDYNKAHKNDKYDYWS